MTVNTMLSHNMAFFAQADMLSLSPKFERKKNEHGHEALFISDIAIFRSGSFRDSIGEQHTFDKFGIETFVRNFEYLKSAGTFTKPVVRSGHVSLSNDRFSSVIGYINNLNAEDRTAPHDGQTYTYLLADFEIIDDEAIKKIESGLWVNRSAEMGPYEDNNGMLLHPVITGVAYVDVSAVEGLNFSKDFTDNQADVIIFNMEDNEMGNGVTMPSVPAAFTFKIGGNDTTDFGRVQGYITELESKFATSQAESAQKDTKISGLETENTSLKEFQKTVVTDIRHGFVDDLCKQGKLLESSKEALYSMVDSFDNAQFDAYKASMGHVPQVGILQTQQQQFEGDQTHDGEKDDSQFEADKGVIDNLRAIGKSDDVIKGTAAYARLIAADPKFTF